MQKFRINGHVVECQPVPLGSDLITHEWHGFLPVRGKRSRLRLLSTATIHDSAVNSKPIGT